MFDSKHVTGKSYETEDPCKAPAKYRPGKGVVHGERIGNLMKRKGSFTEQSSEVRNICILRN